MVLDFQVVVLRAEEVPHGQGVGLGPLVVPGQKQPGELPGQTGRQGDEALVVLLQQIPVDPWLKIEALGEPPADQGGEIPVAHLIFAQQNQMIGPVVDLVDSVKPGPGGHVDLAANDGLDARSLGRPVKVHRPVHHPVVGDRHGGLPQFLGPGHQALNPAGTVQQAVFRMNMKMDK